MTYRARLGAAALLLFFNPGFAAGPNASSAVQAIAPDLTPAITALSQAVFAQSPASAVQASPLSIRITSPLGRTGSSGAIRIVAQVTSAEKNATLSAVRFYVDDVLVGEDPSGPPYAVEWTDVNPFERREIRADVADSLGHVAHDAVVLKPLEIVERTEISSVYVETSVQDKTGKFVKETDDVTGYQISSEWHDEACADLRLVTLFGTQAISKRLKDMQRNCDFSV